MGDRRFVSGVVLLPLLACGRVNFDPQTDRERISLRVDHTKVAGDLTDFPVLVDLDLGSTVAASELRFLDAAGALVPYEIESADSRIVAWVKLPSVSSATDTPFYVDVLPGSSIDGQQPSVVWSDYASVYHFGASDPLDVRDATGNNPGTNNGATSSGGQILGAARFPGGPSITANASHVDASPGGSNTVSFWFHYDDAYGKSLFAFVDASDGAYDLWMESAGCFGFNTENGDVVGIPAASLVSRWVHIAAVFYNGVPDTTHNQLWIDGVQQPLTTCAAGTPTPRIAGATIAWASVHGYQFVGLVDEGRISAGVRSPAWIRTEIANQSSPSTFVVH